MIYVHDTGAVLLFGSGALFCWVQTSLTVQVGSARDELSVHVRGSLHSDMRDHRIWHDFLRGGNIRIRRVSSTIPITWSRIGNPRIQAYPAFMCSVILASGSQRSVLECSVSRFFQEFQKISLHVECSQKCEERQSSPLLEYANINSADEE